MSFVTTNCRGRSLIPWSSGAGSPRQTDRSSRASTPPTARRGCATSSRKRACSSSPCSRRARSAACRSSCRSRSAFRRAEFLVFNQELATLLKAGMPLVQSLDLLKRRVESPLFRTVLDDVHEKVRSGSALSDAFAAHGDRFPARVHRVAARRRAQRQPRRGAAPLRRVREGHRDGEAQDAIGADLSGHPRGARAWPRVASSS